jgi:hypothetical protein
MQERPRNRSLDRSPSSAEVEDLLRIQLQIESKLQDIACASRDVASMLNQHGKMSSEMLEAHEAIQAKETSWLEQKRTLENSEIAHQATVNEMRKSHRLEIEGLRTHANTRISEVTQQYRELQTRAKATIQRLEESLHDSRIHLRRAQQESLERQRELEAQMTEYEARMKAEATVSFMKLDEIEKRHAAEIERMQFEFQSSKNFILASNQRLEEIAAQKEIEILELKKKVLILGGDPHKNAPLPNSI